LGCSSSDANISSTKEIASSLILHKNEVSNMSKTRIDFFVLNPSCRLDICSFILKETILLPELTERDQTGQYPFIRK